MITTIVFDCFGVLAQEGWTPFKAKYLKSPEQLAKAKEINYQMDIGNISFNDFIGQVSQLAGTDFDYTYKSIDNTPVNKELVDYIKRDLKNRYKIGLLSNAGDDWMEQIFGLGHGDLFDEVALSYAMGYAKPDPNAYRVMLEKINSRPSETVFIDDQHTYIVGAQEYGLKTVHHKDNATTISKLEKLLG